MAINNPNVSQLTNYVEQKRLPLIGESFLTGKTVDLIQLETGIKQEFIDTYWKGN